jgi:iron complex transport system ATP-binding protein
VPSPAVELAGVRVWRALPEGGRAVLLDAIDWRVEPGERWAMVGANGAGKTTLLQIAGAAAHPSAGAAHVLGHRLGAVDTRELRAAIGHVDSAMAAAFKPRMSAREVALTGATSSIVLLGWRLRPGDRERADELLAEMGCGHLADRPFARLSRGERQRALLARALMPEPRLLLLDEATEGLDLPGREAFLERLDSLGRSFPELATVQVSHHIEDLASSTSHALLLRAGRTVAAGPVEEALTEETLSRCFDAPVRLLAAEGRRMAVVGAPALAVGPPAGRV